MFLRSTDYDVEATSALIVAHFETKREFFGDGEILSRPIRQSDLDDEARNFLEAGSMQVLPQRDSAGRIVIVEYTKYLSLDDLSDNKVGYQMGRLMNRIFGSHLLPMLSLEI